MREQGVLHGRLSSNVVFRLAGKKGHMMNEDSSGEGRAMSQTRLGTVLVPGPATPDPYSSQGDSLSDAEGGRANGYLRPSQDEEGAAAQALLHGNSISALEGTRSGGAGGNRKGHHADNDTWWKRARIYARGTIGQANWHIRSMARQQTLRVVKSREKAATETALSQALLKKGTGAGRGGDVIGIPYSTSVGRGLSDLGVGEGADRAEVELASMEAGNVDGAGTSWGDDKMAASGGVGTKRALDTLGSSRGIINGGVRGVRGGGSGSKLKRGGRQAVTTGDLIKLLQEEECVPAPNESKSVANKVKLVGCAPSSNAGIGGPTNPGHPARWNIGGGAIARRASEGVGLAHVAREDRWASGDRSFKVLGVEIGHLPDSQQFMVCAGGVFAFLLVYGFMQEYLVVQIFNRRLGLFLTLLQFFGYAVYAWLRRCFHKGKERKIPLTFYFFLGLLQACMQALTNVSMMYLNYPAKVLFKSSRMVPIMCFGVLWQGRKYAWKDYVVVFLIVTGLVTFMNADTRAAEPDSGPTSLVGVALISLALVIDAALINIQEEIMNKYNSCQDELIMFTYLSGTVFIALACLYTGDLVEGCRFVYEQGMWCILAVMLFAGAGFLGVSCVAALTKRFGALASAITTTARKAGTLLLSFVVFPKPVSLQHYFGACLFITGLVIKSTGKRGTPSSSLQQNGSSGSDARGQTSPPATPLTFQMTRQRKRYPSKESDQFDTSTEAPLLSGTGNGGYSSNGGEHGTNGSGGDPDVPTYGRSNGTAAIPGNSGGNPVRHRGPPKNGSWNSAANSPRAGGLGGGGFGGVATVGNEAGGEVGGYYGSRHAAEESNGMPEAFRSPRRRIFPGGSPPVTGLGMRL